MAWTTPATWSNGVVVSATDLNNQVRDNLRYLKGLDGVPYVENAIEIPESATPATPASGRARLFAGTDGILKGVDDAGATAQMVPVVGGVPTFAAAAASTGLFTATAGLLAPRSGAGTATFAIDTATTGSALTLANLAVGLPFGSTSAFSGLLLIQETAVDGAIAMFLTGGGQMVELADPSGLYTTTGGTPSSINVYLSSLIVGIENRRGGSRTFNITAFRIRNSQ